MIELSITNEEMRARKISPAHLEQALDAIREDGFVVLHNTVNLAHCDALYERMRTDCEKLQAHPTRKLKELRGNQLPPREKGFLFEDVVMNPIAMDVLDALMGASITCGFYNANVSLPGCGEQVLHVDQAPRKAEDPVGEPCDSVVINVPLIDFTVENGATEIWPGTHMTPCAVGTRWVSETEQAERATVSPPIRAVMPKGALLIRDIRLWHRGPSNTTNVYRPMIAMILGGNYDPKKPSPAKLTSAGRFPRDTKEFFDNKRVWMNPEFVDGPVDYLNLKSEQTAKAAY